MDMDMDIYSRRDDTHNFCCVRNKVEILLSNYKATVA